MCMQISGGRSHQRWCWAGDEIVQEPIIPAAHTVPSSRQTEYRKGNRCIAELEAQIAARDARIAELESEVKSLTRRVAELEARLRRNSTNSSKPPSSDPPGVRRMPRVPTAL
jgi:hypothetical protein